MLCIALTHLPLFSRRFSRRGKSFLNHGPEAFDSFEQVGEEEALPEQVGEEVPPSMMEEAKPGIPEEMSPSNIVTGVLSELKPQEELGGGEEPENAQAMVPERIIEESRQVGEPTEQPTQQPTTYQGRRGSYNKVSS